MAAQWLHSGAADKVREDRAFSTEVDGFPIVIARCGNEFYAMEDRCTHDGESFAAADVEECEIICPRHFARFCLKTGAAPSPPPRTNRPGPSRCVSKTAAFLSKLPAARARRILPPGNPA